MSERKWTEAQKRAISYRGSDLLVSASAGSGKTAALTARLIDILCSPSSDVMPSEVLAVTFTNAACDEMRSRLFDAALAEISRDASNVRARRLLSSIESVQICTIHSFCRAAIAPYFAELGLVSDFRVADETEAAMLSEKAIGDVVSRLFNDPERSDDLSLLADTLSESRDETSLDRVLLEMCRTLAQKGAEASSLLKYADMLDEAAKRDLFETSLGEVIKKELVMLADHYEPLFSRYAKTLAGIEKIEKYVPTCEHLADVCRVIRSSTDQSYSDAKKAFSAIAFPDLARGIPTALQTDESLDFRAHRDAFKKAFGKIYCDFFGYADGEISDSLRRTAELDRALARLSDAYETRFTELKRERGALDFGDLERLAHRLFVDENGDPTPAARRVAEKYRYVFIDEYQDTNRAQDDIFRAIACRSERFMVGDVKQSIYSFRGADVSVFSSLRRAFMKGEGGEYVFMSENFRCASNVIKYANAVSRAMFPFSDTPFDRSDELIFARDGADCADKAELVLLSKKISGDDGGENDDGSDSEEVEYLEGMGEAQYVARRVSELISDGKKADGTPILAGDIAILCRSASGKAKAFADALEKLGIPAAMEAKRDIFADETMLSLISILNAVVRPELDIYFTGALRAAPFGFSLDDVVRIRLEYTGVPICAALDMYAERNDGGELCEKCRFAIAALRSLRASATLVPPEAFIRHLAKTLDLESALSTKKRAPETVRRRIRELRTLARSAADGGFTTLFAFIEYLERMMESGRESAVSGTDANAVRIMTIHHAKGLEFPVCILTAAAAQLNLKDSKAPILFEPTFGVAAKLPDPTGLVKYETILHRVSAAVIKRRAIEEEMRVLYVALTRARDRLIAVASLPDAYAEIRAAEKSAGAYSEYSVRGAKNYLRWLIAPVAAKEDCGAALLAPETPSDDAVFDKKTTAVEIAPPTPPDDALVGELCDLFEERFSFEYPYEYLRAIPAKLTVSRLYPEILDEDAELEALAEAPSETPVPRFLAGTEGEKADAAKIGTATHVFMQFCDFARLSPEASDGASVEERVRAELSRLVDERFIDRANAALVDVSQICAFVCSPLFRRIRAARRVWREFRFNAARPAYQFTGDVDLAEKLRRNRTDVIVQGVVDLMFEDENGRFVLVDYKTDRLTDYERAHPEAGKKTLRERHRNQLTYYRDILSEMAPSPIDETLIYSLTLADTITMD